MNQNTHKYIVLLFTLNLFWASIYFSISSIIGISSYENGAPGYTDGILVTGLLSIGLVFATCQRAIRSSMLFTIFFPLFFLAEYTLSDSSSISTQYFTYYIGFSIPASYIGAYIANNGGFSIYTKWLDVVMIIITLGLVLSISNMTVSSSITNADISFGGASYQQMAYMSGLSFTLNLCGILFGHSYERFEFMNTKYSKYFCFILLVLQLVTCFYSGGRGGFIYLVACSSILLIYSKKTNYIYYIILFLLLLYVLAVLYRGSIIADIISERMERTFSFINSTGGINTQNREDVWLNAERLFEESSFFGTGVFPYYHIYRVRFDQPYAHNIFWELLIQRGFLYLIFWLYILAEGIKILYTKLKENEYNSLLIIFFLFPFITLCFSSTYLQSSHLWFFLSYLFASTSGNNEFSEENIEEYYIN